ncbi:Putative cobyrinic acid a,c-diamide synthase [Methyloversatilis universalis FAM5]|jgi:chromosome partitioning protein|uniref:Cobyrinic acid a,c-diamide synthase n=1 Tax=Methyloversatilis universalis (strain ATCC BAA-1314 / DSM 25237 / JCM 13912 / CCUG 52030 / FAM5) TaxID=1000565 RepID=F5RD03_METUF|nr:ParA family protein [Methyloversatilis universalis]EGK71654.1 Putative cobyrinic acid a,c-diamide synthase [Methyloversatilis universalis FAM5]
MTERALHSVLIANPKGGAGKSTLATNVAGHWASQGARVMLGDIDRQQSARHWLALRSPLLSPISTWDIEPEQPARPPRGTTHVVLDTPAGLRGKRLEAMLKMVDRVLIPVQPSIFDILATGDFLTELAEHKRVAAKRVRIGIVGMRVDTRTRAAQELERFCAGLDLPVLTYLRNSQLYVQAAAHGMTIFDLSRARAQVDREQWQPLIDWLDSP